MDYGLLIFIIFLAIGFFVDSRVTFASDTKAALAMIGVMVAAVLLVKVIAA